MPSRSTYAGYSVSLFLALTLCALVLLAISVNTRYLATVEQGLRWISQPVVTIANLPLILRDTTYFYFSSRAELESENENLRHQLALSLASATELQDVKNRLDELLSRLNDFRAGPVDQLVAEIILINPNPNRQEVTINKGEVHGLSVDSMVMDGMGLRGRVIEVFEDSSRVLQVNDKRSGIPVLLARTGQFFILSGNGANEPLTLDNVNINADIQIGDEFVTSGIGQVYPRGFLVGSTVNIVDDVSQATKYVEVTPSAELDRKTYLRVVIKGGEG